MLKRALHSLHGGKGEVRIFSTVFVHSGIYAFIRPICTEHPQLCAKHRAKCLDIVGDRQVPALMNFLSSVTRLFSKWLEEARSELLKVIR